MSFDQPVVDFHAFAPEIIVVATLALLVLIDAVTDEFNKWAMSAIAGIGLLAAMLPIITLGFDGVTRTLFGGAYVVDNYSLVLKALFLLSGYVVVLLSTNYIAEGDYWEGEYYQLILASVLGMMVMASARDLVSIFVALELLSIPAYMLAAWRKRDVRSDEAGMKYYLMGVFASGVMLYGMSLLYGYTGTTQLSGIATFISTGKATPLVILSIIFVLIGFAFKVSAVPFHTWAPDTYEGAPTPVTAFLAVASKAAGFVALTTLIFVGFYGRSDVYGPFLWVLSALTMTVGNLVALRQTNVVRMLAYSGVAQAGYILAPLAVAGSVGDSAMRTVVTYLVIYAAMNLGAFAVVIAVSRRTGSAEMSSFNGLFSYAPGLTVAMSIFLFSLAGIPPLAGWFGKFLVFQSLVEAKSGEGYLLAVLVGLNSVIALFYYSRVARAMWMEPAAEGLDTRPITVPIALRAALAITVVITVVVGILPSVVSHFTNATMLVGVGR